MVHGKKAQCRCRSVVCAGIPDYVLLNEGVDIVEVNQVIMLRPTQSPIVFIQQLGAFRVPLLPLFLLSADF